jgi:hypothetical protein
MKIVALVRRCFRAVRIRGLYTENGFGLSAVVAERVRLRAGFAEGKGEDEIKGKGTSPAGAGSARRRGRLRYERLRCAIDGRNAARAGVRTTRGRRRKEKGKTQKPKAKSQKTHPLQDRQRMEHPNQRLIPMLMRNRIQRAARWNLRSGSNLAVRTITAAVWRWAAEWARAGGR